MLQYYFRTSHGEISFYKPLFSVSSTNPGSFSIVMSKYPMSFPIIIVLAEKPVVYVALFSIRSFQGNLYSLGGSYLDAPFAHRKSAYSHQFYQIQMR